MPALGVQTYADFMQAQVAFCAVRAESSLQTYAGFMQAQVHSCAGNGNSRTGSAAVHLRVCPENVDILQMAEAETGHFMYAHEISGGSIPEFAAKLHLPKYFLNNYRCV